MKVVRIAFKKSGKKYFFDPNGLDLKDQDRVVVDTIRGHEFGYVHGDLVDIEDNQIISPLKQVIRLATKEDIDRFELFASRQDEVVERTKKLVSDLNLDMKVLGCEFTLDGTKLVIYFASESRVDFRELVKKLAAIYKNRIELRQVGERDASKVIGGIGPCGLVICCNTFLGEFDAVSIKMAKTQNLSLNPTKLSGICGKLLCCLKYENETYKHHNRRLPKLNKLVNTPEGEQKVIALNVLKEMVTVVSKDGVRTTFNIEELLPFNPQLNVVDTTTEDSEE